MTERVSVNASVTSVLPSISGRAIWAAMTGWLAKNIPAAAVSGIIAAAVSLGVTLGSPLLARWSPVDMGSVTPGNVAYGALWWGLASALVSGSVAYWWSVGTRRFVLSLVALPASLRSLLRTGGHSAVVHLLWGAGAGLFAAAVISPAIGALVTVAVLVTLPSALGGFVSSLLWRLWSTVIGLFSPIRRHPLQGAVMMAIGIAGSLLALSIGFFVADTVTRTVTAGVCLLTAASWTLLTTWPARRVGLCVAAVALGTAFGHGWSVVVAQRIATAEEAAESDKTLPPGTAWIPREVADALDERMRSELRDIVAQFGGERPGFRGNVSMFARSGKFHASIGGLPAVRTGEELPVSTLTIDVTRYGSPAEASRVFNEGLGELELYRDARVRSAPDRWRAVESPGLPGDEARYLIEFGGRSIHRDGGYFRRRDDHAMFRRGPWIALIRGNGDAVTRAVGDVARYIDTFEPEFLKIFPRPQITSPAPVSQATPPRTPEDDESDRILLMLAIAFALASGVGGALGSALAAALAALSTGAPWWEGLRFLMGESRLGEHPPKLPWQTLTKEDLNRDADAAARMYRRADGSLDLEGLTNWFNTTYGLPAGDERPAWLDEETFNNVLRLRQLAIAKTIEINLLNDQRIEIPPEHFMADLPSVPEVPASDIADLPGGSTHVPYDETYRDRLKALADSSHDEQYDKLLELYEEIERSGTIDPAELERLEQEAEALQRREPAQEENARQQQIEDLMRRRAQHSADIEQAQQNLRALQDQLNRSLSPEEAERFNSDPTYAAGIKARIRQNQQQIADAEAARRFVDEQLGQLGGPQTDGESGYGPRHGLNTADVRRDLENQRFEDAQEQFEKTANAAANRSARAMAEVDKAREKVFNPASEDGVDEAAFAELLDRLKREARGRQQQEEAAQERVDIAYEEGIDMLRNMRDVGRAAASFIAPPASLPGVLINAAYGTAANAADDGSWQDVVAGVVRPIVYSKLGVVGGAAAAAGEAAAQTLRQGGSVSEAVDAAKQAAGFGLLFGAGFKGLHHLRQRELQQAAANKPRPRIERVTGGGGPRQFVSASSAPPPPGEANLREALGAARKASERAIPMEKQSRRIQELDKTRRTEEALGGSKGETKEYVDTRGALEQLRDTRSSRTAKQAPAQVRDAIINTREDKLYAPADKATIKRVSQKPEVQAMMEPGDTLKMDTFQTPGKTGRSLGADRDARLVIVKKDGSYVEVPRKHWENDAYADFYKHTSKLYPEGITPQSHPGVFKRAQELQYLKGQGLTKQQIFERAWAEEHNQLFTDRFHMEASAANADQVIRVGPSGRIGQAQGKSPVVAAQKGAPPGEDALVAPRGGPSRSALPSRPADLKDPEGYARMWKEKSHFYEHNMPEALAQSQKGIAEMLNLRDGYRSRGMEPPPLPPKIAQAMEIVIKAPVGVDATPQAMAKVTKDLQALGFRNAQDAMAKIAYQNEGLKWSRPTSAPPAP
jgi:hypothetical protein